MTKSTIFRACIFSICALFFTANADAQVSLSAKKKKEKAKKETTLKADDVKKEEKEKEFYWSYSVLEVIGKPGNLSILVDENALKYMKTGRNDMAVARKAAAGGMNFESELQLLSFMSENKFELVSVINSESRKGPATKMYFKKKMEK